LGCVIRLRKQKDDGSDSLSSADWNEWKLYSKADERAK
jgi:hypothetical protein